MKTMRQAARLDLHERDRQATAGLAALEREVQRAWRLGLGRQQIIERTAQMMYGEDLRELGWVLDLGFLTWEMYLEDAELLVTWLLQAGPASLERWRCSPEQVG